MHTLKNKILVCITTQSNSKRLIDKGAEILENTEGELLILHILKGDDIFASDESTMLLQELFEYGKLKGGIVHALSGTDIFSTIKSFARENKITHMVLGQSPVPGATEKMAEDIQTYLPQINTVILDRGL